MTNFTIYRVALLNKAKEEEILNNISGNIDLLEICNQFYKTLKREKVDYYDNNGNKRTFSISSEINFLEMDRQLITHIDSAYTGENYEIRNGESNKLTYYVDKTELQSRKIFSLFSFPKNSKYAYVVFENKSKHGVKVIFERQLQIFLKTIGFEDYRIEMTPGLNFNYLSNMIENGKLKKVRLINNRLSKDIQLSLWDNLNLNCDDQDIREIKFKSKTENSYFKKELYYLFFSRINKNEKIQFLNQYEIDEVSFEINFNSSSKTFYLKDKSRMRSNIDVTKRLNFIDGNPTYESKKKVALDLIIEIIDNDFINYTEVA